MKKLIFAFLLGLLLNSCLNAQESPPNVFSQTVVPNVFSVSQTEFHSNVVGITVFPSQQVFAERVVELPVCESGNCVIVSGQLTYPGYTIQTSPNIVPTISPIPMQTDVVHSYWTGPAPAGSYPARNGSTRIPSGFN